MQNNFGVGQQIYSAELYDKVNNFDYDIPFYLELSEKALGSVLELCCGSGRITLPLAKKGVDITGLDYTDSMLKKASEKFKKAGLSVNLVKGDMRDFNFDRKFNLIFIPFNSIQNTYTFEHINAIFTCVKKHLDDEGIFAFDIFNPDLNYLTRPESDLDEIYNFELDSGKQMIIKQSMRYDKINQVNRVKWHHFIDGKEHIESLDMRCFFPQEMDYIIRYNGFEIVSKYGDFDKNTFGQKSAKQIYVLRKINS